MDIRQQQRRRTKLDEHHDAFQIAINSRYLAVADKQEIVVQSNDDGHQVFTVERAASDTYLAVLALSSAASSLLAVSQRTCIQIYDVERQRVQQDLHSSARTITTLSWSPDSKLVASGGIDGTISCWDLLHKQPIAQCRLKPGIIRHIAWSKYADQVVAVVNDDGLYLWTRSHPPQVVITFAKKHDRLQHLCWSDHHSWTILASSVEGRLCMWDLTSAVARIRTGAPSKRSSLLPTVSLISQRTLFGEIIFQRWIGEQRAAFLYHNGTKFAVVDLRSPSFGSIDWELELSHPFEAFTLQHDGEKLSVRMISRDKHRTYHLPSQDEHLRELCAVEDEEQQNNNDSPLDVSQVLSPVPIATLMQAVREQQPQVTTAVLQVEETAIEEQAHFPLDFQSTLQQVATPLLELPRLTRQESDSPMPFLSPAIPAKRPAWNRGALSGPEDIVLPSLHADGYFGSFSSATVHDSDSDDDAYDLKNIKDGTQMMRGGVNVPLPRSCGAVFSTNGTLISFRPPSSKPVAVKGTPLAEQTDASHQDIEGNARLFPTFGNLFADVTHLTNVVEVVSSTPEQTLVMEALGLDKASYSSRESWKPHSLSSLPAVRPAVSLPTVQISVLLLQSAMSPEQQLARQYRVLIQSGESGSAMCLANAAIAINLGCSIDALIWQTLSKVIDTNAESGSKKGLHHSGSTWADHPLGACWLIRRMYAIAESHASLQMLACITAVLLGSVATHHLKAIGAITGRLPIQRAARTEAEPANPSALRAVPALSTKFSKVTYSQQSPSKSQMNSALSSRGPSLPTTPRLDSSSSTPPWSFAPFGPSSSKLSFSSSTSPENVRSSFSAAVKSYAQSVSDKFASYGTSPPIRKGGLSPNTELSSSLPGVGGSWTKSVSFASTTTTQRSSTLAVLSNDDEEYDSDRTVDDNIVAPIARAGTDRLSLTYKNKELFSQASAGLAASSLIPDDLIPSCRVWVVAYAERLRCWRLHTQAVVFDKIGAVLVELFTSSDLRSTTKPLLVANRTPAICGICVCIIGGLEQVCLLCRHTFHMACLQEVLGHDADGFECPVGCGCVCAMD